MGKRVERLWETAIKTLRIWESDDIEIEDLRKWKRSMRKWENEYENVRKRLWECEKESMRKGEREFSKMRRRVWEKEYENVRKRFKKWEIDCEKKSVRKWEREYVNVRKRFNKVRNRLWEKECEKVRKREWESEKESFRKRVWESEKENMRMCEREYEKKTWESEKESVRKRHEKVKWACEKKTWESEKESVRKWERKRDFKRRKRAACCRFCPWLGRRQQASLLFYVIPKLDKAGIQSTWNWKPKPSISPHCAKNILKLHICKNRACHIYIRMYIWTILYTRKIPLQLLQPWQARCSMQRFRLFLGQCIKHCKLFLLNSK